MFKKFISIFHKKATILDGYAFKITVDDVEYTSLSIKTFIEYLNFIINREVHEAPLVEVQGKVSIKVVKK